MSSLLTKKQDTKITQNIDNKQDTKTHLLDNGLGMASYFTDLKN